MKLTKQEKSLLKHFVMMARYCLHEAIREKKQNPSASSFNKGGYYAYLQAAKALAYEGGISPCKAANLFKPKPIQSGGPAPDSTHP